jgi:ATP-dependent DNA helicase RecG
LEIRSNDAKKDPVKASIDAVNGFIDPVKGFSDTVKDLENRFNLTKNQLSILKAVVGNKKITQKKLAKIVGVTRKNIVNNMKKLKEKGVLKRVGSDKAGYWKVLVKLSETDKKK